MKRCQPWEQEGCPLAQVCEQGSIGAMYGRAAIMHNAYCNTDQTGEICGPITSYYEAALCAGTLRKLDEKSPWTHNAKIATVPVGEAPLEIRESIAGVTIPIRQDLQSQTDDEHTAVHPLDFILALDKAGKLTEAQWYRQYTSQLHANQQALEAWHFQTQELAITNLGRSRSVLEEYGMLIWQRPFLGSAWSGFVLEPALFSRVGNTDGDEFFTKLQEVADQEYGGDVSVAIARKVVAATFEHNNLTAIRERGPGRLTTVDSEGNLLRVVDEGGVVVYDKKLGIDERETPENAKPHEPRFPAEEPFVQISPPRPRQLTEWFS